MNTKRITKYFSLTTSRLVLTTTLYNMGTGERSFSFSKKVSDHKADRLPPSKAQVEKKRQSVNFTVHFHEAVLNPYPANAENMVSS